MKKLDAFFAFLGIAGFAGLGLLAAVILATLIAKGPANVNLTTATEQQAASEQSSMAQEKPQMDAVSLKETEIESAAVAPIRSASVESISVDKGAIVFKKCTSCHTIGEGEPNKVGPNLWSIVNKQIASVSGFKYSKAMSDLSSRTWDVAFLDEYLAAPRKAIKGTKMSFVGLKKQIDRNNVIAYLAAQSELPINPEELGLVSAAVVESAQGDLTAPDQEDDAVRVVMDPPARTAAQNALIEKNVALLRDALEAMDYEKARHHPLHFKPQIEAASNEECLVCHQEVLTHEPREQSPAGLNAESSLAWYQTLDTYEGKQESFHYRHLESPFAKQVMNLSCNFCHKGNDPREETPDMQPGASIFTASAEPNFTLRKMVNPSTTCLLCHGAMPDPLNIMGIDGPWSEVRDDYEDEQTPNGCLVCHEETFRTVRHEVTYLKAASIEKAAQSSSDVCLGCHGGRQWYRIAYPYPRHPWPYMDEETPEWAKDRPTVSDSRYQFKPSSSE